MDEGGIRRSVRERYAGIARQEGSCCGRVSCCGSGGTAEATSRRIGYSAADLEAVPRDSNLGLGCGNPIALAALKEGETVLDLGSGAGFDCFLAAGKVGPAGSVIGVDMTPEMVEKARGNARAGGYGNVAFRLGEIEHLPAADGSVDAVISNCVINLSPDKAGVFAEAYRVLRPGGRLMISDIVLAGALPEAVAASLAAYAGCIAGAVGKEEYLHLLEAAGFRDVRVVRESRFRIPEDEMEAYAAGIRGDADLPAEAVRAAMESVVSVHVFGTKP